MNFRFSFTKSLLLIGILVLPVYGTVEVGAGVASVAPVAGTNNARLSAASGIALDAGSRAFGARVSGTTAGVVDTLNSGINSVGLRVLEAASAISSLVTGTAAITDELTLSAADMVDGVVARGCAAINAVAQRAGGIALSTAQSGTASIAREVQRALQEIDVVAKETGEEITNILEVSTKLMQSLTSQGVSGVTMVDGVNSIMAILAEHTNNVNQHGLINTMNDATQFLAHSSP